MTAWFRKADPVLKQISTPPDLESAAQKLRCFIAGKSKLVEASELTDDTRLFSSGLLDSLTFVELVLFVEREFHIKLSDAVDVNMDSLDSIEQILGPLLEKARHT
jgi:acyl carrier protein